MIERVDEPKANMGRFDRFIPRMPSDEEMTASSARWLETMGPCLIDRWPSDLLALSADTIFVDLPQDNDRLFDHEKMVEFAAPIADEVDRKLGWERRFFRLNSRSPKDAPWPFEALVSCSGKEILGVMACSERMLDDLGRFRYSGARPKLCLREFWPGCRPQEEFRCFLKGGDVLAVAEYTDGRGEFWTAPHPRVDRKIRKAVDVYLSETVKSRLPIDTVVVDIWLGYDGPRLVEINPYGLSNPVGAGSYAAIEAGIDGIARLSRTTNKR